MSVHFKKKRKKTQWTQWIWVFMGELLRCFSSCSGSLSLCFHSCACATSLKTTFADLQSLSLASVKPKLESKIAPNPQNWGRAPSSCGNTNSASPADFLPYHVPFPSTSFTPLLRTFIPSFVLSFNKSLCKTHMMSSGNVDMWMCY